MLSFLDEEWAWPIRTAGIRISGTEHRLTGGAFIPVDFGGERVVYADVSAL